MHGQLCFLLANQTLRPRAQTFSCHHLLLARLSSAIKRKRATTLYRFSFRQPGLNPRGMLVRGNDGNFYGTTLFTSVGDLAGVIFKITPAGRYSVLHSFDNSDGYDPESGLALGSDGNFYGVTAFGGQFGAGTIFTISPSGTFTSLYQFTGGSDGSKPYGRLLKGTDGNFYGTTIFGGSDGLGSIFSITPAGSFYRHL